MPKVPPSDGEPPDNVIEGVVFGGNKKNPPPSQERPPQISRADEKLQKFFAYVKAWSEQKSPSIGTAEWLRLQEDTDLILFFDSVKYALFNTDEDFDAELAQNIDGYLLSATARMTEAEFIALFHLSPRQRGDRYTELIAGVRSDKAKEEAARKDAEARASATNVVDLPVSAIERPLAKVYTFPSLSTHSLSEVKSPATSKPVEPTGLIYRFLAWWKRGRTE